jgi:hypothetical protein
MYIARPLDRPAFESKSFGRRRNEDEPRAVRDCKVACAPGPGLDAADEAARYGRQKCHPVLARESLASRSARELPTIAKLLGEDRSSGTLARHLDDLPCL